MSIDNPDIIKRVEGAAEKIMIAVAIVIIGFFLLVVYLSYRKSYTENYKLSAGHRYTIGIIEDDDGEDMILGYHVNKKYYSFNVSRNYKIGDKVLIKYYPPEPDVCMVEELQVPDTFKIIPSAGWKSIPWY